MLRFWKEKLDRWAINLAAGALPQGKYDCACLAGAAELLANGKVLEFPDIAANLHESDNGSFHFPSSIALGLARNDTVHGRLFRTGGDWRSRPMVILVHGWNAELHYLYMLPKVARALNSRGMNAALIELPLHLQRRPPRDSGCVRDFISDDLVTMLGATRQSLADIHALARWGRSQGCEKIAVWGFSLGAWLTGLYICQPNAASQAILTTPIIDLGRAIRELPFCHPVRAALGESGLDLARLNLAALKPRMAPDAIYICQCEYDQFIPLETYEQLTKAWELPELSVRNESHLSVLISRRSMRATADWLAQQAGLVTHPNRHPAGVSPARV